jgi:hypothetical protein
MERLAMATRAVNAADDDEAGVRLAGNGDLEHATDPRLLDGVEERAGLDLDGDGLKIAPVDVCGEQSLVAELADFLAEDGSSLGVQRGTLGHGSSSPRRHARYVGHISNRALARAKF